MVLSDFPIISPDASDASCKDDTTKTSPVSTYRHKTVEPPNPRKTLRIDDVCQIEYWNPIK